MAPPHLHLLLGRADAVSQGDPNVQVDPTLGVKDPHDLNQVGFLVLFGLIGAALVLTGIWFFFWAKNGGFHFKENDWDDYKSTVLRRTGPNGTILSNATKPTNLGGGSVYKDYDDTTVVTESTGLSGITAGASDIAAREKRKRKQQRREKEREKERRDKGHEKKKSERGESRQGRQSHKDRDGGAAGVVIDEDAEKAAQEQLKMYRAEKAARVGGMNKSSDASVWDGNSTNPTMSVASSEAKSAESNALLRRKEESPANSPVKRQSIRVSGSNDEPPSSSSSSPRKQPARDRERDRERTRAKENSSSKKNGIRKVYSTADRRDVREQERIRAEAKKLADTERNARNSAASGSAPTTGEISAGHRREFSWSMSETDRMLEAPPPARGGVGGSSGIGGAIPELSALRQGYRRGRGEDYEEE